MQGDIFVFYWFIYLCIYASMFVCMHICIHVCIHLCIYVFCMYACMYVWMKQFFYLLLLVWSILLVCHVVVYLTFWKMEVICAGSTQFLEVWPCPKRSLNWAIVSSRSTAKHGARSAFLPFRSLPSFSYVNLWKYNACIWSSNEYFSICHLTIWKHLFSISRFLNPSQNILLLISEKNWSFIFMKMHKISFNFTVINA